jgi:NAD(P)-dependent dehydrogenase (short-subunit alcohol dehydrogenase family)
MTKGALVFLCLSSQLRASSAMTSSNKALGKKSSAQDVVNTYGGPGAFAGRTAVVTGGATGIGLETCKALAYAGYRVIIASRNPTGYAAKCEEEIRQNGAYQVPDAKLEHKFIDLAELSTVADLARELQSEPDIDLLVLNAGIMALPKLEKTSAGFEKQIAVNHFSHQLLYTLLEPKLQKQAGGCRVVSLASTAHTMGSVDPADLHYAKRAYTSWGAYGQSKAANILFAKEVVERNAATKVTAVSLHPGVIRTPLWRNIGGGFLGGLLASVIADKSVQQGASTTVFACLSTECGRDDYAGVYLSDCNVANPSAPVRDPALRKALWEATEAQLTSGGFLGPK